MRKRLLEEALQTNRIVRNTIGPPMKLQVHTILLEPNMMIGKPFVVLPKISNAKQRLSSSRHVVRQNHKVNIAIGPQGGIWIQRARCSALKNNGSDARRVQNRKCLVLNFEQVPKQGSTPKI